MPPRADDWIIPGEFVPTSTSLASDPAIIKAGALAELLYRRSLEHAKRLRRDGIIYTDEITGDLSRGIPSPRRQADALVRVGLWTKTGDGWQIRSFLKWNLSREQMDQAAKAKRDKSIRANHSRWHKDEQDPRCPVCRGELSESA